MKARLENGTGDMALEDMEVVSCGVLTAVYCDSCACVGDPVIRVKNEVFFPVSRTWVNADEFGSYRVRPLKDGERIVIEA